MTATVIGLTTEQLNDLISSLLQYPCITEAVVYGSRAKGNFHQRSDLDLALKGNLDRHLIADLRLTLDDSMLPIAVDLLNYSELSNPALKAHIDRVGVTIFSSFDSYKSSTQ